MARKVVAVMAIVILSVVLVGGQTGDGFVWWGTREPIYIFGNDGFTRENGVVAGSGSAADPYIIEGWQIDMTNAAYGIYISNTTRHFIIRRCVIKLAGGAAIRLSTVRNGRIEENRLTLSDIGIHLINSHTNIITGNVVAYNHFGVVMAIGSRGNTIYGNSFIDNGLNGHDPAQWNTWHYGGRGNYWSDYEGVDLDHDGVGDRAHHPLRDRYPLIVPPVAWKQIFPVGPDFAGLTVSPCGMFVITSETPIVLEGRDPGIGLAKILYSIDGGAWREYTGPFTLSGPDGPRTVAFYGVDRLGNVEAVTALAFLLDNNPPQTAILFGYPNYLDEIGQWITSNTEITLELLSFSTYGETATYYAIDGGRWRRYTSPFTIVGPDGPRVISFFSRNASGNTEAVHSITVFKDNTPPATRGVRHLPGDAGHMTPAEQVGTVEDQASGLNDTTLPPVVERPVQTPSQRPGS